MEFVSKIFSGFTDTIKGLTGGLKDAFLNLIYVDPSAEAKVLSDVAEYCFVAGGVVLAIGIVWGTFRLIRAKMPR